MSDFDNAMYHCVSSAYWWRDTPNCIVVLTTWACVGDDKQRAQYGPLWYSASAAGSSALFRADTDKLHAVGDVGRYPFPGNASHAKTVFKSRQ